MSKHKRVLVGSHIEQLLCICPQVAFVQLQWVAIQDGWIFNKHLKERLSLLVLHVAALGVPSKPVREHLHENSQLIV